MQIAPTIFRSREEQAIEAREGRTIPELLNRLYHTDGLNQAEVAARLGVSSMTIRRWMRKYDIPTGYNRSAA